MAFKKMVTIAGTEGMKKYVYYGEQITFCLQDEWDEEYQYCTGVFKLGDVYEEKKKCVVDFYDPRLDRLSTYDVSDIKVLEIHKNEQLRAYFNKVGEGNEEVREDKGDNGTTE